MLPAPMRSFIEQQNSPHTRAAYEHDLLHWCAWSLNETASVELAVGYKKYLLDRYAASTARRMYSAVKSYFAWLTAQDPSVPNYFGAVKPPLNSQAAPKVPSDVEVERVLRGANNERERAVLCLLLNGLRAQEVADLRVADWIMDLPTNARVVRVVGKGNRERFVPLTSEAHDALVGYVWNGPGIKRSPDDPLIVDSLGEPITRHTVAGIVRYCAQRSGVRGVSPHSFRHHYATRLYRVTRDVLGVGKLLGHTKPETTMRYARLDLVDVVETAHMDPRHKEYNDAHTGRAREAS